MTVFTLSGSQVHNFFNRIVFTSKKIRIQLNKLIRGAISIGFFLLMVFSSILSKGENRFCAVTGTATTTATCAGASNGTATITLTGDGAGAPGTYTLDGGAAQSFSTNPFTITGLSAGNHTVIATVTAGGCVSGSILFNVSTSGLPIPVISASATPASICIGSSSTLNASGASAYTWQPGSLTGASVSVSPVSTTTYTVTGANADGCSPATTWLRISSGGNHTLGIKTDGTLWAWGSNDNGQIGDGTLIDRTLPVQIGSANDWAFVSGGSFHSLAIKNNGTLWAWGDNATGQLGDGTAVDKLVPVQVGSATNWSFVSAGGSHSIGLRTDGTMWGWGANNYNQVGDGTSVQKNSPVQIGVANNWAKISAGSDHNLAIKTDGTLWAWGRNTNGQLGDGTIVGKSTPVQIGVATNWSKIAGNFSHSIALRTDGTLWTWGQNNFGQIGDGTTVQKTSPVQIGAATDWTEVDGGLFYSIAQKSNGTLWSWGYNVYGMLGDGTTVNKSSPIQSGTATNWTQVSCGLYHLIGLRTGGTMWSWGWHMNGRLGDGSVANKLTATQVTSLPVSVTVTVIPLPAVSFSGLASTYCLIAPAVTLTGSPAGGTFSGPGISGNTFNPGTAGAGTHNITYSFTNVLGCTNTSTQPVTVSFTNVLDWVNLQFPGTASVCQGNDLAVYGQVFEPGLTEAPGAGAGVTAELGYSNVNSNPSTWINWQPATFNVQAGNNDEYISTFTNLPAGTYYYTFRYAYTQNVCGYQYGGFSAGGGNSWDGTNYISGVLIVNAPPNVVLTSPQIINICEGASTTLTATGAASYTWMPGSLNGSSVTVTPPVGTTNYTLSGTSAAGCVGGVSWLSLSAGGYHNLGIKTNGTLWNFGNNTYGQLGDGTNVDRLQPTQIGAASNWSMVSAGSFHSLAIKSDGTLWAWGLNNRGQVGDGTTVDKNSPLQIGSASNWLAISAGGEHSMAIKTDGTLWAWGYNQYGQLGDGTVNQRTSPVQIGTASNWASISAGSSHSLAIKTDGTLWSWGRNTSGQLGNGTVNPYNFNPLQVGSANNWKKIAAAFLHSLAIRTNGTLWAWGRNMNGQLGDGTVIDKSSPLQVGVATDWASVDGGLDHTIATKTGGTLWGCGFNNSGQVGDGTLIQRTVLVQSGVLTDWLTADAGIYHSTATKKIGSLFTYGRNMEGQLGDGSILVGNKPQPTIIGTYPLSTYISVFQTSQITATASPSTICVGASTTLTANYTGPTYIWTPGNLTGRIVSVSPVTTTTYTVISTEDPYGCHDTTTVTVTVNPLPVVSFTGLNASYCVSDAPSALVGSPAGGTYPGLSGNIFDPAVLSPGPYTVTYVYTDPVTGCTNMSQQNTTVSANLPVSVSISANTGNVICTGTSVTFTAIPTNGGTTPAYQWYKGASPVSGATGSTYTTSGLLNGDVITVLLTSSIVSPCVSGNPAISNSITFTVNPLPTVSFSGLPANVCNNTAAMTLTGNQAPSGSFSGPGINNLGNGTATFTPAFSGGAGVKNITYTYSNGTCSNTATQQVTVVQMPGVSFTGLPSSMCLNAAAVTLVGSPSGGSFSGPGISGNTFNPSLAGAGGPFSITYSYTDPSTGCTNTSIRTVTVNILVTVSFTGLPATICNNTPSITLTGNLAPSGTFSGPGINNLGNGTATFTAAFSGGAGIKNITYTYSNGTCSNSVTQQVTVVQMPGVIFSGLPTSMCLNASAVSLVGSPSGGTFSGIGVSGNTFNPTLAGAGGPFSITYSYTDPNTGCTNTSIQTVTVIPLPVVSFNGLATTYCITDAAVTLTGNPVGGTFSGTGISGNVFNPAIAGIGSHNITYTYSNGTCSNSATSSVTVLPNYAITATAGTGGTITPSGNTSVCSGGGQAYTINANIGFQIADVLVDGISVGAVSAYTFSNVTAIRTIQAVFTVSCTNPSLSANITHVLCNGGTNAAIDLVVTGGSSPFTFAWTGPGGFTASTEDITGLAAGVYMVTVTTTGGCTISDSYTINQPAALVISCSGSNVLCNGANNGTASVSVTGGTGPYTYSWTDGSVTNGSVNIDPSKDNTVYAASTTNSNALGENFAIGKSNSGNTHRALMAFDIFANVPAGSVINSATLTLNVSASAPGAGIQPVYLHKLITDWGEGTSFTSSTGIGAPATTNDATWLHSFYPATNWTNSGGDFEALSSAVTNVNNPAFYSWSSAGMVSDIQAWLNTPANNYGWLVKGAETANSQSKRIDSRENSTTANRPVLTVDYTTPNVLGTSNTLSNLPPGTYTVIVTDANGCISTCTYTVTEPAPLVVSFSGLAGPYCSTDVPVTLTGSPAGGTFSGPGISGNTFDPSTAGPGTHTIVYSYTNGNGCSSTSSQQVTVNTCGSSIAINLKLFLQGYYIDGGIMQPVLNNQAVLNSQANETDSIMIELHDPVTFALVDSKVAVLLTGGLVSTTFTQPPGSYYIAIKHRNTIQTWSANQINCSASTPLYDFTAAAGNAMGANQVEVQTGKWAFFTGDLNQDDFIDGNDFPAFDTDSFNGVSGVYAATDMNGDGFVDGNDFPVFDVNSFNGVSSVHP